MLIIGARGFAKEVLQLVYDANDLKKIAFFDNITKDIDDCLFDKYPVIKSVNQLGVFFGDLKHTDFVLGLGNPLARKKMFDMFLKLGCKPKTVISNNALVGDFDVTIGIGCNIMQGSVITNSITLGKGCLVNSNSTISHDTVLGDFVEISPMANVSGRCHIGSLTFIGASATILPDVNIGKNCIIGAGSVVLNNIPDNSVVVGVPGKIIKTNH